MSLCFIISSYIYHSLSIWSVSVVVISVQQLVVSVFIVLMSLSPIITLMHNLGLITQ